MVKLHFIINIYADETRLESIDAFSVKELNNKLNDIKNQYDNNGNFDTVTVNVYRNSARIYYESIHY